MSFESAPLEQIPIDHQKIVDFAVMRLWRNGSHGLRKALSDRDIVELTRSEWLSATMRLVAQLSDGEAELSGSEITQPTQRAFYLGELLAMDIADSISLELGIHTLDYRSLISEDERISDSFVVPELHHIEDVRRALGEAILRRGMSEAEDMEEPYQDLLEAISLLDDESGADIRAFSAGFGTMFPKARRALSTVAMAHAASTAKRLFPTASVFEAELTQLLDESE